MTANERTGIEFIITFMDMLDKQMFNMLIGERNRLDDLAARDPIAAENLEPFKSNPEMAKNLVICTVAGVEYLRKLTQENDNQE